MEEILFKDISYLELWEHFCSEEWNHLCNFGRGYYEEQFCEIIWIWASGSGGDIVYKISYLELWQPSCSVEQKSLCKFRRGHHGEHSCEIIWNLDQWFKRRCRLKKKLTHDRRTTDAEWRPITIAHVEPKSQCELKTKPHILKFTPLNQQLLKMLYISLCFKQLRIKRIYGKLL